MLASTRMRELTDEIAQRYSDRVVIFDSPPVLATTTATALAPLTGQLVLVVAAGSIYNPTPFTYFQCSLLTSCSIGLRVFDQKT